MILKGNQRGGAKDLALHLMKEENEHIELHELRGFASDDLMGALNEAYAVSRGTRCKKFLYSLSLNPPPQENVRTRDFEAAIERVEEKLGLSGQPRAIVFHEKEGRRHAHAVWSRIRTEEMKAVQLSHDHKKLNAVSREIFLEHGWKLPRGLADSKERDPRNFTLEEWQQAKRAVKHARDIKTAIQDAWAMADSRAAFAHALEERGYKLARGDRRGFVAVDMHGEAYSIARQAGVKTKDVRERLGDAAALLSVRETTTKFADEMARKMDRFSAELDTRAQVQKTELQDEREKLVQRQRAARSTFDEKLRKRQHQESIERQARFRTGLAGLWDRLRGEHKRIRLMNESEAATAEQRDREQKDQLIFTQLAERRRLKQRAQSVEHAYMSQKREIDADRSGFEQVRDAAKDVRRDDYIRSRKQSRKQRPHRSRGREPEP